MINAVHWDGEDSSRQVHGFADIQPCQLKTEDTFFCDARISLNVEVNAPGLHLDVSNECLQICKIESAYIIYFLYFQ